MKIRNLLLSVLCVLPIFCSYSDESKVYTTSLIEEKGMEYFFQSEYRAAFWPLSQHYEMQQKRYCGIASAVMVLNALNIPRPCVWTGSISTLFTQDNFFSEAVCQRIDKPVVDEKGVSLAELSQAIEAWGVHVDTIYSDSLSIESFRELLKCNLVKTDRFIIANYYRNLIQKENGGHISPIAAYDQKSDSVLVMDVFRCRNTGTWVDLVQFFAAMQTIDSDSGLPRGLIIVQRPETTSKTVEDIR